MLHATIPILSSFCSKTILIKAGSSGLQMSLFRRTSRDVNIPLAPQLTNQDSPLEGQRKQRRLWLYNSLPVFFLPLIHPSSHSPPSQPVSILLTLFCPHFHFLTPFPLTTLDHLPSPSTAPRLILSVSRSCCLLLTLSLFLPVPSSFTVSFCLYHPLPFSFVRSVPASRLPHQRDRTMGAHLLPWPLSAHQSPCQILPHG